MQPQASRPLVLVADDEIALRAILKEALEMGGFKVETASNGAECLEKIAIERPDLILLDVEMPVLNGWKTLGRIKADPVLRHLPVLMLTSLSQTEDKVIGLELGANDYITKPFEIAELIARCRAALRDTRADLEANPLSQLPGNAAIERDILARLGSREKFCVLYADLNNFKSFNDRYGFLRGDRLIQHTARLLVECADAPGDFIGHIGGDDFILNTRSENAEPLCQRVIAGFDKAVGSFYDDADRKLGFIEVADRKGDKARFPLVGIAIGGVCSVQRELTSLGQISQIGAEMKTFVKRAGKSAYAFDRRKD